MKASLKLVADDGTTEDVGFLPTHLCRCRHCYAFQRHLEVLKARLGRQVALKQKPWHIVCEGVVLSGSDTEADAEKEVARWREANPEATFTVQRAGGK